MRTTRLLDATLACYPKWWRAIYGEEIRTVTADLAADGGSEVGLAADLLRGAVATRLRGTAMPRRRELWATRTRVSIAVATLPWLVVVPFVLVATSDRQGLRYISEATISNPATRVSTYAFNALEILLVTSFVAMVMGWSALVGGLRWSSRPRRHHILLLSYVPLLSFLADLGLFLARQSQVANVFHSHGGGPLIPLDGDPSAARALLMALWVVFVAGAVASACSLVVVTKHADLPMLSLRSGKRIATFTAVVLTLMAAAAVVGAVAAGNHGLAVPSLGNFLYTGPYAGGRYQVMAPEWWLAAVPLAGAAMVSLLGRQAARKAWHTTVLLTDAA